MKVRKTFNGGSIPPVAAQDNPLIIMKKYLTVGYAYPVYFLLILGQYFLAAGLNSLYDAPDNVPTVAQTSQHQSIVPRTAPGADKEARTALTGPGKASGKGR